MRFETDPALIEETVFLALQRMSGADARRSAYAAEREQAYALESEAREKAFADLHARWFARLMLERPLRGLLGERPLLGARLELFLVRPAYLKKEEGAELFVSAAGDKPLYRAVLCLKPETMLDLPSCEPWVRHELFHLADMLDPAFKYDPKPQYRGETAAQKNMVHDRFTTLWNLRIDARLAQEGRPGEAPPGKHAQRLARTFGDGPWLEELTRKLYAHAALSGCDCPALLRFASNPVLLLEWAGLDAGAGPRVSARACPACGFPSQVWVERPQEMAQDLRRAISRSIQGWTPEQGLCRQCEEMFSARCGIPVHSG